MALNYPSISGVFVELSGVSDMAAFTNSLRNVVCTDKAMNWVRVRDKTVNFV